MTEIIPSCRFCGSRLEHSFIDLGMSPLCQTHIKPEQLHDMEPFYPLCSYVCTRCFLVQLDEYVSPTEIFGQYDYFSSYSSSWVQHAKVYVDRMVDTLGLNSYSLVVEVASNDGYLLQHFVSRDIPVLGIEPAVNVAEVAMKKGIPTLVRFFGAQSAREIRREYGPADLLLGNNVLAHVPDIKDFVRGMKSLLAEQGTITMEFPHLLKLIDENQYDTIYHEHFSYLSLYAVEQVFEAAGLALFDVEQLPTHGGSLRIYARHSELADKPVTARLLALRQYERERGINTLVLYQGFEERVKESKRQLLEFLIKARRDGKQVVGYGAPGKGNTLLNYCGIRQDFLDYTVDKSPQKQGKFTPGCRIPIFDPAVIKETRPDYVLILPWNLQKEISMEHQYIKAWGGQFVVPIPSVRVLVSSNN